MLIVTPAALTVTANNVNSVYGTPLPAPDIHRLGSGQRRLRQRLLKPLATSASESSNVGGYAITQGTLSAGSNYAITYTSGTLTVNPASLSVTADNLGRLMARCCRP